MSVLSYGPNERYDGVDSLFAVLDGRHADAITGFEITLVTREPSDSDPPRSLESFSLEEFCTGVTKEAILGLASMNLKQLRLDLCFLSEDELPAICHVADAMPRLEKLYLDGNSFGDSDNLAGLLDLPCLSHLALGGHFGNNTARHIARKLVTNNTLEMLSLRSGEVGRPGLEALKESMKHNTKLDHFDFPYPRPGEEEELVVEINRYAQDNGMLKEFARREELSQVLIDEWLDVHGNLHHQPAQDALWCLFIDKACPSFMPREKTLDLLHRLEGIGPDVAVADTFRFNLIRKFPEEAICALHDGRWNE